MTYNNLLEDLRRYLERGFTAATDPIVFAQLPRLINTAERRIATELKIQGFIKVVTAPTVPNQPVYAKPDRWRDTIAITINYLPILPRSYDYLRNYWPVPTETGTPEFYADYDYDHWLIVPTPATVASMEILFYELPALLDDETQTNWLTAYAPNLLLYGCLVEATPFLKDDTRIPVWQAMYDRAAESINGQDVQKILDRATVRTDA